MTILPWLVNISTQKVMFTPEYVDLRALLSIVASRIYAFFVVKFTRVPRLGGGEGGSSQSWQCQDFHGFCYSHPSLTRHIFSSSKFQLLRPPFLPSQEWSLWNLDNCWNFLCILASQDAIEVMLVWEWVIVRIDLTDVTLVSDDAYKILYWCDPDHPDESYVVMKVI